MGDPEDGWTDKREGERITEEVEMEEVEEERE